MNDSDRGRPSVGALVGWAVLLVFVGSIFWSIWFETLLPLVRAEAWGRLVFNLAGIPLILLGTLAIVYGGFIFVTHTFSVMGDKDVHDYIREIRKRAGAQGARWRVRWANFRALLIAWRPGFLVMALGFLLLAIGSWLSAQGGPR